jgi:glutamyl-tRNA synthetase
MWTLTELEREIDILSTVSSRSGSLEGHEAFVAAFLDTLDHVLEVKMRPALANRRFTVRRSKIAAQMRFFAAADRGKLDDGNLGTGMFMSLGNAVFRGVGAAGAAVPAGAEVEATLHLEGDFKKTRKVTWLADSAAAPLVPLLLVDYDFLITVPKLDEGDDFEAAVNPVTKVESRAWGEPAMRDLPVGAIVQLERKDFFRVDANLGADKGLVLILVPDGKPRTWGVGSKVAQAAKAAAAAAAAAPPAAGAKKKGAK